MLWRIPVEAIFALALFFFGRGFWAAAKSPGHLRKILGDPSALKRIIDEAGFDNLRAEAQIVKLLPGTQYSANMFALWDMAHFKSIAQVRNWGILFVLVVLAASFWLGIWYFAVSLIVFILRAFSKLPPQAINDNLQHLNSVIMHLNNWQQQDEAACAHFCERERPEYKNLHQVLAAYKPQSG